MPLDCDILIAGAGLVGLSLALALRGQGLRVTIVDPMPLSAEQRGPDERHLALSEVSCRILTTLGVLPSLGASAAPIRALHVSSAGEFGVTRWSAADAGRERFGVVVPARRLLSVMQAAVLADPAIDLLAPATARAAAPQATGIGLQIRSAEHEQPLQAQLLVIADGAESSLRQDAGIAAVRYDYERSAICCALTPERDHQGTAYERFTRTGPVALLPQAQGRCGAVFVVASAAVPALMALPERAFLSELQTAFGYRLGRFLRAGQRVAYPLRRILAERLTAPRQVLIGNAAQALHPVGAQGFNLGLRDAAALAERLLRAHRQSADLGADTLLNDYSKARSADRNATTGLSHALALSTSATAAPVGWLRTLALLGADRIEPLREHLQLAGMGYAGPSSELARGLMP